jgi:hypothetical protein
VHFWGLVMEFQLMLASLTDASIAGGYAAQSTPEAKLQWLKDAIVSFDIGSASGTTFFYSGSISQYLAVKGIAAAFLSTISGFYKFMEVKWTDFL